jgi:hypothetical protein
LHLAVLSYIVIVEYSVSFFVTVTFHIHSALLAMPMLGRKCVIEQKIYSSELIICEFVNYLFFS